MIKIEPMTLDDLDQVMAIEKATFKDAWKRSFFEHSLNSENSFAYVVKENNQVIGYLNAWQVEDEMNLDNIAVAETHRRKGIGSQLLSKLIEVSKKNKCKMIYLEVRISNITAQKIYEKFGFEKSYSRKEYYPDGEEAIIYEKKLAD